MPPRPIHCLLLCLALAAPLGATPAGDEAFREEFRRLAGLAREAPQQALLQAEEWLGRTTLAADGGIERRHALRAVGAALRTAGRYGEAAVRFEQALAIRGNDLGFDDTLRFELGATFGHAGLHAEAMQAYRAALAGFEARADWQHVSALLGNIGNELDATGDVAGAREHYLRALALKREHGIDRGIGGLLSNLADYDLAAGDAQAAADRLADAIAAAQDASTPDPVAEAVARGKRAVALARLGRFAEADAELAALDAVKASVQPRLRAWREEAAALVLQARAAAADGHPALQRRQREAALGGVRRALEHAAAVDEPQRRERLQRLASELAAELEDWQAALRHSRLAEDERSADEARRQRDREAALVARYQVARHERELADLRAGETLQRASLERQQQWLLLAATALTGVLLLAVVQRRRIAAQRQLENRLQAHNRALGAALDQAEAQRRRAEQLSRSHGQLLRLAGDELRPPLLRLRATAERLFVGAQDAATQGSRLATMTEAIDELLRVSEQMIETGSEGLARAPDATVDVGQLLADLIDQAATRMPARRECLRLEAARDCHVRVDGSRLQLVLLELLQLLLDDTGESERRTLRLQADADGLSLALPDPHGHLGRRLRASVDDSDEPGLSLGALWIRRAVEALGGEIAADDVARPGELILRLPAAR